MFFRKKRRRVEDVYFSPKPKREFPQLPWKWIVYFFILFSVITGYMIIKQNVLVSPVPEDFGVKVIFFTPTPTVKI